LQRRRPEYKASLVIVYIVFLLVRGVEVHREATHVRSKGVERSVEIFAEIDTSRLKVREQFLKRDDLLFSQVAAVINHDIHSADFLLEAPPEISVGLVADKHFDAVTFIGFAGWLNVDAEDLAVRSEVVPPHPQAAATIDPNLQYANAAASKSAKVPVVNVKIVVPLPDSGTFSVRIEVGAQRVWRFLPILRSA
jgi:hypothetical protein